MATDRWAVARRVLPPATIVLIGAGLWMGYYNFRVTGSPWRLPYQVWQETYTMYDGLSDMMLFWRQGTIPDHGPPWALRKRVSERLWHAWFDRKSDLGRKLFWQWQFYVTLTLTPALVVIPFACRRRGSRFALFTAALVLGAIVIQNTHGHAHYAAPAACLFAFLLVQGLRWIRCWKRRGRPAGQFLVRSLVLLHIVSACCLQGYGWVSQPLLPHQHWALTRQSVERELQQRGGCHFVLVQYPADDGREVVWEEWVYNPADIDSAAVIWARDSGPEKNERLRHYYNHRRIWLLQVDGPKLRPLPPVAVDPSNTVDARKPGARRSTNDRPS